MMMYNLFTKYFIVMNLLIFSFMSLSFIDYIMIWFFMEITNLLFIYLMNLNLKNKKLNFFYFIIQTLASFPIIICIILNNIFMYNNYIYILMILALLMKLSIPPFHLWLPTISTHLSWDILFILLTIQKIMPFYMISLLVIQHMLIYLILLLCSIIPPYMMFNLYNFKMLLSYSSMNQSMWMIMLTYMKPLIWLKYFMFYSLIMFILFIFMSFYKILLNFKYSMININKFFNLMMIIIMCNMASMPPFSFFYMKWFSIFIFMQNSNLFFIFIIMMLSSLIMLYIYVNMMLNSLFFYKFKSKLQILKFTFKNKLSSLIQFSLFMSLIIMII